MNQHFGTSDAYSAGLRKLGWQAAEVVPNSTKLQSAWAREAGRQFWSWIDQVPPSYVGRIPLMRDVMRRLPSLHNVFEEQVKILKPDVLYFQDLNFAPPQMMRRLRKYSKLIVGQIASPLPPLEFLRSFDLVISSLPNLVEHMKKVGVPSRFLPIAFDHRILDNTHKGVRDIDLSFVGGISKYHNTTIPLLESVLKENRELQLYGYGAEELAENSELRGRHFGEKWGDAMYDVLARSKVTLNRHISVAENYANNMRLFEATGMGSLLVTDYKENLADYFDVGTEVLAYSSYEEAAHLVNWAMNNPKDASDIARLGQAKTLTNHTYDLCMEKLDEILKGLL